MARKKPLSVIEPTSSNFATATISFEKPVGKSACKIVDNVDELVSLLHNEAKVI
jgi:electron transfer flavoprotein beta subunit